MWIELIRIICFLFFKTCKIHVIKFVVCKIYFVLGKTVSVCSSIFRHIVLKILKDLAGVFHFSLFLVFVWIKVLSYCFRRDKSSCIVHHLICSIVVSLTIRVIIAQKSCCIITVMNTIKSRAITLIVLIEILQNSIMNIRAKPASWLISNFCAIFKLIQHWLIFINELFCTVYSFLILNVIWSWY